MLPSEDELRAYIELEDSEDISDESKQRCEPVVTRAMWLLGYGDETDSETLEEFGESHMVQDVLCSLWNGNPEHVALKNTILQECLKLIGE